MVRFRLFLWGFIKLGTSKLVDFKCNNFWRFQIFFSPLYRGICALSADFFYRKLKLVHFIIAKVAYMCNINNVECLPYFVRAINKNNLEIMHWIHFCINAYNTNSRKNSGDSLIENSPFFVDSIPFSFQTTSAVRVSERNNKI